MKYKFFLLVLICFFLSCKKEQKANIDDVDSPKTIFEKYEIFLSKDTLFEKVNYFLGDTLKSYKVYLYYKNLVKIYSYNINELPNYYKQTYFLNNKGYADSMVDSNFISNIPNMGWQYKFSYNSDNYLIGQSIYMENPTFYDFVSYDILNGNTVKQASSGVISTPTFFEFENTLNKVDINNFIGDFRGKKNTNLMKSSLYSGLIFYEKYVYTYNIDYHGFVNERICDQYSKNNKILNKRVTKFEYKY